MTKTKRFLCGATVAGLVAGTGAVVGTETGLSAVTADWMLAAEHVLLIGTDGTNLDKILEYAYNANGARCRETAGSRCCGRTAKPVTHRQMGAQL